MNENSNFLDGFNGFGGIILILLFFIMFGNGGLWGGGNNQINSDFLYRDIQGVNTNVLDNKYTTQLGFTQMGADMAQCCCNTQKEILQNRYDNAIQTNTLQAQMTANTQAILDKICNNEIQNLRDALAEKDRELAQSNLVSANALQTQNILNAMGKWYSYPSVNPYCGYNQI